MLLSVLAPQIAHGSFVAQLLSLITIFIRSAAISACSYASATPVQHSEQIQRSSVQNIPPTSCGLSQSTQPPAISAVSSGACFFAQSKQIGTSLPSRPISKVWIRPRLRISSGAPSSRGPHVGQPLYVSQSVHIASAISLLTSALLFKFDINYIPLVQSTRRSGDRAITNLSPRDERRIRADDLFNPAKLFCQCLRTPWRIAR